MEVGAVILAGGQSSRMDGYDKAKLPYGSGTFLSHLIDEFSGYEEILISANPSDDYSEYDLPIVTDIFHNCGPINGLYSALVNCRSEALFVVCCDMPLFNRAIADYIHAYWSREYDACLCVTRDGRIHPLCGIYSKRVINVLQQHIAAGNYSMMSVLDEIRVKHVGCHCPKSEKNGQSAG